MNNSYWETRLKEETSPIYYSISLKVLQMNNIFWRGRSFSKTGMIHGLEPVCVMRLHTENYLTIIHHYSCSVAHHWNEHKKCHKTAWVWQADAGEELTAKEDLLHNQTEHKERQRGRFILNYGGNTPHSSDINFDYGKTCHLGEQRRITGG